MYEINRIMLNTLVVQLKNQRTSWEPHWKDVAEFLLPYRHRINLTDTNRGDRRNLSIIDPTASIAARTWSAGIAGNVTSPARPWFNLTPAKDPELAEFGPVKEWADYVRMEMLAKMARSNVYQSLPVLYKDLGGLGTGVISVEEDLERTIHTQPYTAGEYWIANDYQGRVNTLYREFRLTVDQIVSMFGRRPDGTIDWSRFTVHVKNLWERGDYQVWIDVAGVVQPNPEWNPRKLSSVYKPFHSCYYEMGASGTSPRYDNDPAEERYLRRGGFDEFPFLCGRSELLSGDAYGIDCPGMTAIGDIKQLQFGEITSGQAIGKMVDPPMVGDPSLKSERISTLPGKMNYIVQREGQQGIRSLYEIKFDVAALEGKQAQIRQRIQDAFYVPLFRMLAIMDDRQRTATEIVERKEEKIVELSPILERLNFDVLDPLVDRTFNIMLRQGEIPKPPPELWGSDLKIEYTSVMAQAMKAVGLASIDRVLGVAMQLAKFYPEIWDKLDADQTIDEYAHRAGAPPRIVRSDDKVAAIRAGRAAQQQAAQQAATLEQLAKGAKTLSETKTGEKNALTDVAGALAGAA